MQERSPLASAPARRFAVGAREAGARLDELLSARVEGLSRDEVQSRIDNGAVYLDGRRQRDPSLRVAAGQRVEIDLRAPRLATRPAERPGLEIVFADDAIVVVDKPAGVASQGRRTGEAGTVPALIREILAARAAWREGDSIAVVHRLDQAASGLMVLARSREAAAALSAGFRAHAVERRYLAVVEGARADDSFAIASPILEVGRSARVDARGRAAKTLCAVLRRAGPRALVEARLETGRLHQVRVHLASVGCPIVGDRRYAGAAAPRLALHAAHLSFAHPSTREGVVFESPLPPSLEALLLHP